jgi:hypothetical protein
MAMQLTTIVPETEAILGGQDVVELNAGETLTIQTSAGATLLSFTCPAGKTCRIAVNITINQN